MMAFDIFTIRRLLLWTLHVWNPLSAACRQIGQSAAGRWRWCPDYLPTQKMWLPGGDICIVCSALIHSTQPGNDYMMATEQRHKEWNKPGLGWSVWSFWPLGTTALPCHNINVRWCPWGRYATKWFIYQKESESGFGQIAEVGFLEIWPIFQVK